MAYISAYGGPGIWVREMTEGMFNGGRGNVCIYDKIM